MNTRIIRTVEELFEVIPETIGFTPTDSLVIVGHNGFTSRVDVPIGPDEISDVAASFEPALKHMSDEVTVVVYGYDQTWVDENVPDMMFEILPGIRVRHMIAAPEDPAGPTRQSIVEVASSITDPVAALRLAWNSWREGNGALANIFLDRVVTLETPPEIEVFRFALTQILSHAISPHDTGSEALYETAMKELESFQQTTK